MHKEKRKGYDSDEDEANTLVIEEDMTGHGDESHSENDTKQDSDDKLNSKISTVSYCAKHSCYDSEWKKHTLNAPFPLFIYIS